MLMYGQNCMLQIERMDAFGLNTAHHLIFFIFVDISPGSSHPSIQRGARPFSGD